jgi:inhibitor of cysteine peptidase
MRRLALLITAIALGTAACWPFTSGASDDAPTTSQPPGGATVSGPAFVDEVEVLLLESFPVQVRATVRGSLPTPCHRLVWTLGEPGADGSITLDLASEADAGAVCAEVLEPFEETVDVGSFTGGDYTLVVNGTEYPFTI